MKYTPIPQYIASCLVDIPFSALIPVDEVSEAEADAKDSVEEGPAALKGPASSTGSSEVAVVFALTLLEAPERLVDAGTEGPEAEAVAEAAAEEPPVAGATSRGATAPSSVEAGGAGTGIPCTARKRKRDPRVKNCKEDMFF